MITTDREKLQTDLAYRVAFDRDFIEFTEDDAKVLHNAAPLILPVVMEIVDGLYDHLFEWSCTKEVFLKRNLGYDGELPESLETLTTDNPQMKMRKQFMSYWCAKVLTADFDDPKFWEYLDSVGIMHTGMPGFKHRVNKVPLKVDLQYLSLTLGWIVDVVLTITLGFPKHVLSLSAKTAVVRAFNKIIWIQQDLFARHYTRTDEEAEANLIKVQAAEVVSDAEKKATLLAEARKEKDAEEKAEKDGAEAALASLPDLKLDDK